MYVVFYQGDPLDHGTHVPGPVALSSAESNYNAACTATMALAHFRMLKNELEGKDQHEAPEDPPLVILDRKSEVDMAKNGKDTKQTRHIARRMHFVWQGEAMGLHTLRWVEAKLQLVDIGTKNIRPDEIRPQLEYLMVVVDP